MIEYEHFHVLNYVKKEEYTGSMDGMRYMLKKKEDNLEVIIWPEPYGYAKTPEEKKMRREFAFSEDGLQEAVRFLNEQWILQEPLWNLSKKMKY